MSRVDHRVDNESYKINTARNVLITVRIKYGVLSSWILYKKLILLCKYVGTVHMTHDRNDCRMK